MNQTEITLRITVDSDNEKVVNDHAKRAQITIDKFVADYAGGPLDEEVEKAFMQENLRTNTSAILLLKMRRIKP